MSGKKLKKEEVKNLLINAEINTEDKKYEYQNINLKYIIIFMFY